MKRIVLLQARLAAEDWSRPETTVRPLQEYSQFSYWWDSNNWSNYAWRDYQAALDLVDGLQEILAKFSPDEFKVKSGAYQLSLKRLAYSWLKNSRELNCWWQKSHKQSQTSEKAYATWL